MLTSFPRYPCITLTSPSQSGGKFWQGIANEHGLTIRWGRIGTQGSTKHFPIAICQFHNPVEELKRRCLKKLHNGYDIDPHTTILP